MPDRNSHRAPLFEPLLGRCAHRSSPAMAGVCKQAQTVARTQSTVLLYGETGVGKGVLARHIHQWSDRKDGPFITVHCAAIPETLIESELFGHEKGAYTGAESRSKGRFELANGGSLFMDEVDTIPLAAQVKLLDVLQERRFHRVGGEAEIEVDIRLIAAANSDLNRAQREGRFRSDLFHRLNVFPIRIPPLRERREDLTALAELVLVRLNRTYGKDIRGLESAVEEIFRAYSWPGNVRELENVLERAYVLETTSRIQLRNLPQCVLDGRGPANALWSAPLQTLAEVRRSTFATVERSYLRQLLVTHSGSIADSALAAGITTRQLRKLLHKHGISKADFKPRREQTRPRSGNSNPGRH